MTEEEMIALVVAHLRHHMRLELVAKALMLGDVRLAVKFATDPDWP